MSIIKNVFKSSVPQIAKNTSYVRTLKVVALILLVPEAIVLASWACNVLTLVEVAQITLFFGCLAFVMPLLLRLEEKKILIGLLAFALSSALIVGLRCFGDAYFVKRVLSAYLDGTDYHKGDDALRWFASSEARSYVRFFIAESDFLKKCNDEVAAVDKISPGKRKEQIVSIKNSVLRRASGLDERFLKTDYSNSVTFATLKMFHRNYKNIISFLDDTEDSKNVLNGSKDCLERGSYVE